MDPVARAIWNEVRGEKERGCDVLQIRVTADALPGSLASVALSPERARALVAGRRDAAHGSVVLFRFDSRQREVVMHWLDWKDLICDMDAARCYYVTIGGGRYRVMGIPVAFD